MLATMTTSLAVVFAMDKAIKAARFREYTGGAGVALLLVVAVGVFPLVRWVIQKIVPSRGSEFALASSLSLLTLALISAHILTRSLFTSYFSFGGLLINLGLASLFASGLCLTSRIRLCSNWGSFRIAACCISIAGALSLVVLGSSLRIGDPPEKVAERRVGAEGPPIVLITVDTLRADHLSLYGYYRSTSPSLSRFARDAVVYSAATDQQQPSLSMNEDNGDGSESAVRLFLTPDQPPSEQKEALSFRLRSGDIVTATSTRFFFISGEVKRPGSYPIASGLTVLKAVSIAGGLTKFGAKGKVQILRKSNKGSSQRIKVNLGDIENGKKPDVPLEPEDIIKVGRRVF